jgi:hypothetical protein
MPVETIGNFAVCSWQSAYNPFANSSVKLNLGFLNSSSPAVASAKAWFTPQQSVNPRPYRTVRSGGCGKGQRSKKLYKSLHFQNECPVYYKSAPTNYSKIIIRKSKFQTRHSIATLCYTFLKPT